MYEVKTGIKWLPASRLVELLAQLPVDAKISVNAVGNLLAADGQTDQLLAYVDFGGDGSVETLK